MQFGRFFTWLYVCLAALVGTCSAQQALNLKKRLLQAPENVEAYRVGSLLRRNSGSSHYLIQFSTPPSSSQIQELRRRGAKVTSYVPDSGFVVSSSDDSSWDGLGLKYVGRLDELDKLSPHVSERQTLQQTEIYAVVDFHSDVDMVEARALVLERSLSILERDGLLPYELLVQGTLERILRLAEWDEVAYIFPASPELVNGDPVIACGGPITEDAPIAQYVKNGTGWPRTGLAGSPLALDYFFGQMTGQLPAATAQSEILRSFNEWAKNANIEFSPGLTASGPRTINILFASGAHGDPYSFDGPGHVLAHTFYPAPLNSEPVAGDMHLDADESWHVGYSIDLYSVTLHEVGHALGLAHSDLPSAVMYPYYKQSTTLGTDDINGIQALYGPPLSGSGTPTPALSLAISSPAASLTTTAASIPAAGTASGGSGTLRITWSSDRGGSGAATGSANWTIAAIPLATGVNRITIVVTDGAGQTGSQTVVVTRNEPPTPADREAPSVQISTASPIVQTSTSTLTLSGTASDNVGVVAVRWANTFGGSGAASGTTNWRTPNVPLLIGTNKITIMAFDAAGNSGFKTITVVRR